jgi:hypothetical protein
MCFYRKTIISGTLIGELSRLFMLLTVIGLVSSCALSNVGSVDMRRTSTSIYSAANNSNTENPDRSDTNVSKAVKAEPLPLIHKNYSLGKDSRVQEGDSLSVTLRTAFVKDFFELSFNPLRGFQANGEIAIVANAFEAETGKEIDFIKMQSGRLVFFSDDVAKGQVLNLNNLPIYGPKSYTGQPFALRITIFELDGGTEQAKNLLNSIAKAGSAAYAPASPLLDLLNGIGQSLFNGAHNDTEFRYTMQFNPRPGSKFINSFVLEAGNYVFIRLSERTEKVPWDRIVLDENKGELFWKNENGGGDQLKPYIDNTYLVVEVNTGGSAKDIDLKQNTFDELLVELKKEDKAAAEQLSPATTAVSKAINQVLLRRNQTTHFNQAKEALAVLKGNLASKVRQREAADLIIRLLGQSIDADEKLKSTDVSNHEDPFLSNFQIDYVISNLRRLVEDRKQSISMENYKTLGRESFGKAAKDDNLRNTIANLIVPVDSL